MGVGSADKAGEPRAIIEAKSAVNTRAERCVRGNLMGIGKWNRIREIVKDRKANTFYWNLGIFEMARPYGPMACY